MHQQSPNMQLSKDLMRRSDEFNLKDDEVKDNQLAPTGSPFFRNDANQMKLLNSTLQKSQASTVPRNAEGTVDKVHSRDQDHGASADLAKDDIKIGTFKDQ